VRYTQSIVWLCGLAGLLADGRGGAVAGASAAGPPATTSAPASTRPAATRPSRRPLGKDLARGWRQYQTAWGGRDLTSQLQADQQLVSSILASDPAEVATLRDLMAREYERLAAASPRDEFHCGRLASRLAVAWTKVPLGKDLSAIQFATNRKRTCEEVCRWAERCLGHFAAGVDETYRKRYKILLPGTVASMMSLIPSRLAMMDEPGRLRERLLRLRPRLEEILSGGQEGNFRFQEQSEKLYKALAPLAKVQGDKQAVRKLLLGFRDAYNRRDDKAFAALWPKGHPATRFLQNRPLSHKIEPSHWTIVRWDPVYSLVQGDVAIAYVVSQYRTRDGQVHPVKLQRFPFKRHKQEGWRLN